MTFSFLADDKSIYASHTTADIDAVQLSLQQDLNEIHKYGREWAITFNATKTIQQTFSHRHQYTPPKLTFEGENVPINETHTPLGLTISKDLRFHQHVNAICNKLHKSLSPIYSIARYIPVKRLLGEERASEIVSPARAEGREGTSNGLVQSTLLTGR